MKRGKKIMAKYVCSVCGYVHEGDAAPERCPVCKVPADKFKIMQEGAALAAEHEYGVYAKTVKNKKLGIRKEEETGIGDE